jgi:hypothetical protein
LGKGRGRGGGDGGKGGDGGMGRRAVFLQNEREGFITSQNMSAFFPTYLEETRQNKKKAILVAFIRQIIKFLIKNHDPTSILDRF